MPLAHSLPNGRKDFPFGRKQQAKKGERTLDEMKLPHQHGEGEDIALLQEQLDHVDYFQTVAEVFKQLDDTTRIRIFWLLCHCRGGGCGKG